MKTLILSALLLLSTVASADVCQIKPSTLPNAGNNIYALMKGNKQIAAVYNSDKDFQVLVQTRDYLIAKGICEAEPVLETCHLDFVGEAGTNSVAVFIGDTPIQLYYWAGAGDTYAFDEGAKKIQMFKDAKVCN